MLLTKKLTPIIILSILGLFVFLQKVFSGQIILPQSFSFGIFTIHYYGIIMALAVGLGYVVAVNRAKYFNITEAQADDLIFWVAVGGFVGARLYHVLSSLSYYLKYPVDVFKVWNGGLSIYGAVLGGVLVLYFAVKISRLQSPEAQADGGQVNLTSSILNLLNWLTPSLILGQIIGRFGNLFNYEAYGLPTNLPWKMFVPFGFRPEQYQINLYFHPFFLYEVLGNMLILFFILSISRPSTRRPQNREQEPWPSVQGFVAPLSILSKSLTRLMGDSLFIYYVLLYNILRFCLEFLRIDSTYIGIFRQNAVVSLVLVLLSAYYLRRNFKNDQVS